MKQYIFAIDHGTTSSRSILFDSAGQSVAMAQKEHHMIYPRPGWVELDPQAVWKIVASVIEETLQQGGISAEQIRAIGITNQRETIAAWNRETGESYGNAIVWQDTRTANQVDILNRRLGTDFFPRKTGLPVSAYFSATKIQWMMKHYPRLAEDMRSGKALVGTMDSYLLWQLTGGIGQGIHKTDITNASRTLLMGIESLQWEEELLEIFEIPRQTLAEIHPSMPEEPFGLTSQQGPFKREVPITAILGDQQAALFGQACDAPGSCKNTYGTGCFMLMNTGTERIQSISGLLTTPAYQWGKQPARYALEGSVAVAGALVQWVRDNLGLIKNAPEIDRLAEEVEDSGDVYFVPAFSGLYAPYWRPDARGVITGLTAFAGKAHLARAVLESTAFQSAEMLEAMQKDSGIELTSLKVDGGMVASQPLMQFQADILGIPVIRPSLSETTALGAAYAAGLNSGFWDSMKQIHRLWQEQSRWEPAMDSDLRKIKMERWRKAVERSLNWAE